MSGTNFPRRSLWTCKFWALSSIHWCRPMCLFVISCYASKFLFNSSWCWETLLFSAYELASVVFQSGFYGSMFLFSFSLCQCFYSALFDVGLCFLQNYMTWAHWFLQVYLLRRNHFLFTNAWRSQRFIELCLKWFVVSVCVILRVSTWSVVFFSDLLDAGHCFYADLKERKHLKDLSINGNTLQVAGCRTNCPPSFYIIA